MKTAYIISDDIKDDKIIADLEGVNMLFVSAPELKKIPTNLPSTLQLLSLNGCLELTHLDNFPPELQILDLSNCSKLTRLNNLPSTLRTLNLTGCDSLEFTEELKEQLKDLAENGCRIIYPNEEKIIGEAKEKLENFATKNQFSSNTSLLLGRYFTEELEQRDSEYALAKNIIVVLDILEKSPEHLGFVEEIATKFAGVKCINQPVAGFFEIASWLTLARAETKLDKLAALEPLITHNVIINLVKLELRNQGQRVIEDLEVELGNALLGKVCDRLFDEGKIKSKWFGVAEALANQETIQPFLTDAMVSLVYNKVLEVMEKPLQERVGDFLGDHENLNIWGQITFPKAFSDSKEKYKYLREPLSEMEGEALTQKHHELNLRERTEIFTKITQLTNYLIFNIPAPTPVTARADALQTAASLQQFS